MTTTTAPVTNHHRRTVRPWHIFALVGLALVAMCAVGTAIVGGSPSEKPKPKPNQVAPIASAPTSAAVAQAPVTPPPTVVVKGKNTSVVSVGAVLNGPFKVDYSFSSWCGIVEFTKADGSEGAQFMETVNECASDTNAKLTGSTIVHLKNVTMVKVDNTRGAWTLTFTPIGAS